MVVDEGPCYVLCPLAALGHLAESARRYRHLIDMHRKCGSTHASQYEHWSTITDTRALVGIAFGVLWKRHPVLVVLYAMHWKWIKRLAVQRVFARFDSYTGGGLCLKKNFITCKRFSGVGASKLANSFRVSAARNIRPFHLSVYLWFHSKLETGEVCLSQGLWHH